MKTIDINENVASLLQQNPELGKILSALGLSGISNDLFLETDAKTKTLKQLIDQKKISMNLLISQLEIEGYSVINPEMRNKEVHYIEAPAGHPIDQIRKENAALLNQLKKIKNDFDSGNMSALAQSIESLEKIRVFYGKKEEIIMPILYRYGISEPIDQIWDRENKVKKDVSKIRHRVKENDFDVKENLNRLLDQINAIIEEDENILFPLAMSYLTDYEWVDVYRDLPEMGNAFVNEQSKWEYAEEQLKQREASKHELYSTGTISLPEGEVTIEQLQAILKVLPIDLTLIDDHDYNVFFSNNEKVFSRPLSALGKPVYDCHPTKIQPIVRQLLKDFKEGKRDSLTVERQIADRPVRIVYHALRNAKGEYIGTVEMVERMDF